MPGSGREELLASAGDQALAAWLGRLQDASFSRAGAVRKAYPPERRMTGPQLAGYLGRRTYALVSSTRPDGRPHAAPTLFCLYAEAFWLPTLGSAARLGNVRALGKYRGGSLDWATGWLRMTPQRLFSFAERAWPGGSPS